MLIIPYQVVHEEIARLLRDIDVLSRFGASAEPALESARTTVRILQEILSRAAESAEDRLTLEQAIEWSGLGADSLRRSYPSDGDHSARRWRRGDLPVRIPYSERTALEVAHSCAPEPVSGAPDVETTRALLERAVAEALAR